MASLGQIIFSSMIILIIIFSAIIILILALAFSGSLSEVQSSNRLPIANLGEDKLLSCYIHTTSEQTTFREMSVTWEKKKLSGVVYLYENGAADLKDQNSQYKGRTQIFPDALPKGNASLLLRSVKRNDEGEYTCHISSSDGGGKVNIHLRTAAFSAPTFTFSNGTLSAEASRWFPKPNVTWLDYFGNVLRGSTSFTQNSAGIFSVVSRLQPVNVSDTYTFRIQNDLVIAVSDATITGSGVSKNTYFTYSAASSRPGSYLSIMISVLCIYCLI
ncbi:V-set domain-containing T-cell activation inhibitor 1 [Thunnus albacares]|uniref:V-set domain-containing T-cell activation inhibitor 1 n=1 Tax=Thunnus albacares TaxID=8236 RepID=UPI001CF639E2|nr:V-set domain-containing T-cell activation inhibitor 1 [Thunnus albacares]